MNFKIGLTGYNGWIGRNVRKSLEHTSCEIYNLDHISRGFKKKSESNIIDLDWILHFGAKTDILMSFDDPFETYRNNILSTLLITEYAKITKSKLLYLSSYVYGQPQYFPIDEKHPIKPNNPYMDSKWISEQACKNISKQLGISLIILRAFNIYGHGQKDGRLISDLCSNIKKSCDLDLNDPDPKRSYLYIKDFTKLLFKILNKGKLSEGTFNLGGEDSYSNLEVAKKIIYNSGKNLKINIKSKPRKNDISNIIIDINKVKKHFNWEPKFSLDMGIKDILNGLKT
jgi:nucleoside-diphosphate-sugar epimerase